MKRSALNRYLNYPVTRNLLIAISLGVISVILGNLKIYVPTVEGIQTDLREIPLLIGIMHLSNPYYAIVLSAISSLVTLPRGLYPESFVIHIVALFIIWHGFNYLKKATRSGFYRVVWALTLVVIYYVLFLIPLFILIRYIRQLNPDTGFMYLYLEIFRTVPYELISTAMAVSIYFMQYVLRLELEMNKNILEKTVEERTRDLQETIQKLHVTQDHLVQSEKMASLGILTSGIAHEINNPLNYISGGINLIKEVETDVEKNSSPDTYGNYRLGLKFISEGIQRAENIVNALRTFSRRDKSDLETQDLHKIIDNTLLFISPSFPEEVEIVKNYRLEVPVPIYAEKMHQVFLNILNNALYEISSGLIEHKKILIETHQENHMAVIKFSNTGRTIDPKYLNKIFDPFFTTKGPDKGKGLGLSICYALITEHQGKISANNTETGVCIKIEIPLNNLSTHD